MFLCVCVCVGGGGGGGLVVGPEKILQPIGGAGGGGGGGGRLLTFPAYSVDSYSRLGA